MVFVLLAAVAVSAFVVVQALPPVIFAPGYGGSDLYGYINYEVPVPCGTTHLLTHSLTHSTTHSFDPFFEGNLVEVNKLFLVVPNALLVFTHT